MKLLKAINVLFVIYSLCIVIKFESYFIIGVVISYNLHAIDPKVLIDSLANSLSTSVTYSPNSFIISPIFNSLAKLQIMPNFKNFIYVGSSALQ